VWRPQGGEEGKGTRRPTWEKERERCWVRRQRKKIRSFLSNRRSSTQKKREWYHRHWRRTKDSITDWGEKLKGQLQKGNSQKGRKVSDGLRRELKRRTGGNFHSPPPQRIKGKSVREEVKKKKRPRLDRLKTFPAKKPEDGLVEEKGLRENRFPVLGNRRRCGQPYPQKMRRILHETSPEEEEETQLGEKGSHIGFIGNILE